MSNEEGTSTTALALGVGALAGSKLGRKGEIGTAVVAAAAYGVSWLPTGEDTSVTVHDIQKVARPVGMGLMAGAVASVIVPIVAGFADAWSRDSK